MKLKDINFLEIFNYVVNIVFSVIIVIITVGIIIGVIHMFKTIGNLLVHKELTQDYLRIISDVLTLFVLIELMRSIVDYLSTRRLRMTFIVDAAIVFVLREVMIKLFEHKITPEELYALSVLLLVLTVLRIGSMLLYQHGIKLSEPGEKVKGPAGAR